MLELLLDHGADIEGHGGNGRTALMMAAMFDRTDLVQALIERGADPHARDASGARALDAARTMGAIHTAQQLETLTRE